MKKFILALLLIPVLSCSAQQRVIDKSGKKPDWVNGLEKDYIIVVGSGASVQDAQRNALDLVKENIVNAVAQNIQVTSERYMHEEMTSENVNLFLEKFTTTITGISGPVSYLQGIILAKVEQYWWEKIQNRNNRSVVINYHIKYPFPNIELQKLGMDFKIRDRELTEQLDGLLAEVDQIDQIEDIEKNIRELRILSDYFIDARQERARLGITQYQALYHIIELVELESSLGELNFALRFRNRFVSASQRPQLTSECARISGTSNQDHVVKVMYDYSNCYNDPENHILVRYRFGNKNVQKPFYFDTTSEKASIFVSEPLMFSVLSESTAGDDEYLLDMMIVSRYDAPFTVNKVVLEWPDQSPVVIENIDLAFSGKGNHSIKLPVIGLAAAANISSKGRSISTLSGYIHYKSTQTGEEKTYRMLNQPYSTMW